MAPDRMGSTLLRAWLETQELTQMMLAERMGIHRSTVGQWCCDNNAPNRDRRKQLERITRGTVPARSWWRE